LDGAAGFGSSYPDLGERWISNRVGVVDPGRLVVAPARRLVRSRETVEQVPLDAVFLDPRTGEEVASVPAGRTGAQPSFGGSVSVSPDGHLVAVTTIRHTTVIDARTREVETTIPLQAPVWDPDAAFWASAWSPDGSRLLLGTAGRAVNTPELKKPGREGDLVVVDTTSWRVERRVVVPGGVRVLEWSPDQTVLAVGQEAAATVTLFDPSLRRQRVVELRPSDYPFDLAFSADGSRLAVGGAEGRVSVLDTESWELVHEPALLQGARIVDVGWLSDGRTVVASGMDERASLYDSSRNLVRAGPFPASDQPPDGRGYAYVVPGADDELVLSGGDQPGHRYPLDPAVWLATACRIAGRDLTRDEWRTYLPDRPYRRTCAEILGG
ncbi:MAG: WD40 repeat domain-containing protein, partial [Nocardioides sp.]